MDDVKEVASERESKREREILEWNLWEEMMMSGRETEEGRFT